MQMQLTISQSHVGDKGLVHLLAPSVRRLERIFLNRIEGATNTRLLAFMLDISHNVMYSAVQDVVLPPFPQWGNPVGRTERVLDFTVDTMPRLRELKISGDVLVVHLWLEDQCQGCTGLLRM